jgi:hypothetical protein
MAVWRYRVARDDSGKLHFVFARYRPEDLQCRCGLLPSIFNEGRTIQEMQWLAQQLLDACEEPIIPMTEYISRKTTAPRSRRG